MWAAPPPTPTHAHPQPSLGRRDGVEAGEAHLCPQGSGVGLHAQGPNSPSPAVSILHTNAVPALHETIQPLSIPAAQQAGCSGSGQ